MVALPLQILTSSARVSGSLRCVDMAPVLFGKKIYIHATFDDKMAQCNIHESKNKH